MTDAATHRAIAVACFNQAWTVMDQATRTAEDEGTLLNLVHTSLYHWSQPGVGAPLNIATGLWQVSRAACVVDIPDLAMRYAKLCLALVERETLGDFAHAFAHEACARAAAIARDASTYDHHLAHARAFAEKLTDEEDQQVMRADLASLEAIAPR
jgi:hypothetical protein